MDIIEAFGPVVQEVLTVLLTALASAVAAAVYKWLGVQRARAEAMVGSEIMYVLQKAAAAGVQAAEQVGLKDIAMDDAKQEKMYAVRYSERVLNDLGLRVDLGVVADAVEAEVFSQFNS